MNPDFRSFPIDLLLFYREIASRNPHSFATDVWSLGILIVTLLTGRPPFDTDSMLIELPRDEGLHCFLSRSSCTWHVE